MTTPIECEKMIAGEDGWSEWIHPLPGYLMQCCDCDLIHEMSFQIGELDGNEILNPGEGEDTGVVIFRARRWQGYEKGWQSTRPTGLEAAIIEFKAALPGWWFSVGECQVSCDASCAPTSESEDIALIPRDDRFNNGFHADLPQPSTLAEALRDVMAQALEAKASG